MYSVEELSDTTVIHVFTDLDVLFSKKLDALIRLAEDSGLRRVVISFAGERYCYSPGLTVLALAHRRIGLNLIIVVPVLSRFRRAFEVTGLSKVLRIAPTLEVALQSPVAACFQPSESTPAISSR